MYLITSLALCRILCGTFAGFRFYVLINTLGFIKITKSMGYFYNLYRKPQLVVKI